LAKGVDNVSTYKYSGKKKLWIFQDLKYSWIENSFLSQIVNVILHVFSLYKTYYETIPSCKTILFPMYYKLFSGFWTLLRFIRFANISLWIFSIKHRSFTRDQMIKNFLNYFHSNIDLSLMEFPSQIPTLFSSLPITYLPFSLTADPLWALSFLHRFHRHI